MSGDGEMSTVEMEGREKEARGKTRTVQPDGLPAPGSNEAAMLLDLDDRDPNQLNRRMAVMFDDVIGEPEGAHSAPGVFRTSYKAYWAGKNCCFAVLTYVCSVPMGFCWGCSFAMMSFCQIWQLTPCVNLFNQCFGCFASLYSTVVHCCLDPCYEAMSLIFTRIFFNHVSTDKGYVSRKMSELNEMRDQKMARV